MRISTILAIVASLVIALVVSVGSWHYVDTNMTIPNSLAEAHTLDFSQLSDDPQLGIYDFADSFACADMHGVELRVAGTATWSMPRDVYRYELITFGPIRPSDVEENVKGMIADSLLLSCHKTDGLVGINYEVADYNRLLSEGGFVYDIAGETNIDYADMEDRTMSYVYLSSRAALLVDRITITHVYVLLPHYEP